MLKEVGCERVADAAGAAGYEPDGGIGEGIRCHLDPCYCMLAGAETCRVAVCLRW